MNVSEIDKEAICFIDTNIWLYAFIQSQDERKNRISKHVITHVDVILSTQIVNEMIVNLIKKVSFPEDNIRDLIKSIYRKYSVHELSLDVLIEASRIRKDYSFSFWDSLVAASALINDADYLISEDMQNNFVLDKSLRIINPFAE